MANNSSYIFNEQAQGIVNGVNKVFTVANTISTIESLRIGYIEYTNFTYSWNTITLADAPSVINWGVYVDYFYESTSNVFDSVNLIYDEVLIGDVNGTNVTFYSIYPIDKVDELRVWWVAYSSFTINGRCITLWAAPSAAVGAPHIDYYRKDVASPSIDSWVTLSELRSSIYTRLGQTITSLQFPKELADEYIVEWITRISKMKRDRTKRWVFTFHKANDWTIVLTDWVSINVGATSKYLPARGIAVIGKFQNVISYQWKSSSSLTSISGLEVNEVSGERIQYGYKLSKSIQKLSEVFINGFKLTPADFAEWRGSRDNDKFCVYNGYLLLPYRAIDWEVVTCVYTTSHNSEYTDSDIIDFDWDYLPVIKSFVLWNMYKDREDDRYNLEYSNYKEILREYKRELSRQYETTSAVFQTASILNKY